MKKLGKIFLVLFVLMAIAALFIMYQPKYSTAGIEPDFQVKIGQLYQAFDKNEGKANQQYVGKVVETSGYINEVSKDVTGATVLLLSKTKKGDPILLCTLDPKHNSPSADVLTIGNQVNLKGQCTGMLMEVVLKNGILLE